MGEALILLQVVMSIIPNIMAAIKAAEDIYPGIKQGIIKKKLVISMVEEALGAVNGVYPNPMLNSIKDKIPGILGTIIDKGVEYYNLTGVFKSSKRIDPSQFGLTQGDIDSLKGSGETGRGGLIPIFLILLISLGLIGLLGAGSCAGVKENVLNERNVGDMVVYDGALVGQGDDFELVKNSCTAAMACLGAAEDAMPYPNVRLMDNVDQDANAVQCGGEVAISCYENGTIILPLGLTPEGVSRACAEHYLTVTNSPLAGDERTAAVKRCSGIIKIQE